MLESFIQIFGMTITYFSEFLSFPKSNNQCLTGRGTMVGISYLEPGSEQVNECNSHERFLGWVFSKRIIDIQLGNEIDTFSSPEGWVSAKPNLNLNFSNWISFACIEFIRSSTSQQFTTRVNLCWFFLQRDQERQVVHRWAVVQIVRPICLLKGIIY